MHMGVINNCSQPQKNENKSERVACVCAQVMFLLVHGSAH